MAPRQPPTDDEGQQGVPDETPRSKDNDGPQLSQNETPNSRQIIETARDDPTAPLHVGTDVETDEPVTIASNQRFKPLLIIGITGWGKTTLCHHLATQQLVPDSGLCYLSGARQPFEPSQPTEREHTVGRIEGDTNDVTEAVPDDIGMNATIHSLLLGPATTETTTDFTSALIEQLVANRHQQVGPDASPYTLVLDDIGSRVEWDRLDLDRLFAEARALRLSVVVAIQTFAQLPPEVQQRLEDHVRTYITGRVPSKNAKHLEHVYQTPTTDDFHTLPHYQWWMRQMTREGVEETQFTATPPQSSQEKTTLKEDRGEA